MHVQRKSSAPMGDNVTIGQLSSPVDMNTTEIQRTRVAVVCNYGITRLGYAIILNDEPDLLLVGSYDKGADAVEGLSRTPADVLIVDYTTDAYAHDCRDLDDAHQVQLLKREFPLLAIVVTSVRKDSSTLSHAMDAGALCYVHKSRPVHELIHAIRMAASGRTFVDTHMMSYLPSTEGMH